MGRFMVDVPLHFQTLTSLGGRLRSGELNPVQLAEHFLARIERFDGKLGALRLAVRDRALAQAQACAIALRAGNDLGPLHGLPYVAKDLFDVRGLPTTAGTRMRADAIAQSDSAATARLERAGMVLLGKTNTVQFAYGAVGINTDQGTPHNPWRETKHVPGGSSSGSAVAVAAGLAPMGLGTDTGGSVRIPAALCGTVGLKTTVGRVSRAGVYPLSFSLDSVGPLTRSVADAALIYQQLIGEDLADETTRGVPLHDVLGSLDSGVKGLRLAFAETVFFDDVDPEIESAVREAGRVLKDLGASVGNIALPEAAEADQLDQRTLAVAAEAYAANREFIETRFDEMDPVVRDRMKKGKGVSGPDYFEGTRRWSALRREVDRRLAQVDALLVPTTMIPALPALPLSSDLDLYAKRNLQYRRNTAIGNTLLFCGLSLPCGFTNQGLPIGLMIYGKAFAEETVLRVGRAYEKATRWHERTPDLSWAR
jgi:aspartyl-tRNA(Asn)/glutamyl-tRNA(Gln) amidotransferase subunit A